MATFTQVIPPDQVVPPFVVKELTGKRRTVRLTGRALPYRPFTLEGEQHVEITSYPGNPIATSTVLGAREGQTTINGYWKDKFIGGAVQVAQARQSAPASVNNEVVGSVEELVDLFDDIRMCGSLIEVQWGSRTRRGHLTKFTQTWHNVNDCEWSAEFHWISRGQPPTAPVVRDDNASRMSRRLSQNWADLSRDVEDLPTNPQGTWYDDVLSAVSTIGEYASQFESLVAQTYSTAMQPFDAVRGSVSVLTGVISRGTTILETLQEVPPERLFFFVTNESGDLGIPTFTSALLGAEYAFRVRQSTQAAISEATIDRDTMLKLVENDVQQLYIAQKDEDLLVVSQKVYRTPDQWRQLMLFNELRTTQLTLGQVLLIPRLPLGAV